MCALFCSSILKFTSWSETENSKLEKYVCVEKFITQTIAMISFDFFFLEFLSTDYFVNHYLPIDTFDFKNASVCHSALLI